MYKIIKVCLTLAIPSPPSDCTMHMLIVEFRTVSLYRLGIAVFVSDGPCSTEVLSPHWEIAGWLA